MAILPWHDKLVDEGHYTREEMRKIAAAQYVMIALCLITLVWLIYNAVSILIKQGKYRVLPLSNFYAFAFMAVISRLLYQIFFFPGLENYWIIFYLFCQTLKFLLGFQQAWINLELMCSIRYSLKVIKDCKTSFPVEFIRKGRIYVILFTALSAIGVATYFLIEQYNLNIEERHTFCDYGLEYYVLSMQIVDFTLLTTTIIVILYYLSEQEKFTDMIKEFKSERRTLFLILVIFDSTYIIRALFDRFYVNR